ncbi:non-homologous end-joining DNA ligase [Paenibacillus sp. KN14-4R]|uniref:non-homologous end-joining DNA ligase n=1 Tax=Paenibacillus sp. KN14-4R TaxID=3445773 RepID=UPI003F9F35D9
MAVETGTFEVEGHTLTLSNPNKLLWPEAGITKLIYMQKLLELAPYLLPYCRDRYLTTIRFPHGIAGKSFYQKNAPEPLPDFVETASLHDIKYVNMNAIPTLLWLGNLACLEFHPSFHHIGTQAPAEWIIDLDPSLEDEPRIMEAASYVGRILQSLNIASVPKTSGATGVQIYIPIKPGYTFNQLRTIGHFIAKYAAEQYPNLFTIERLKKHREKRIYVDYLQHWIGKTLSAPYTPRAKKYATVSTPLTWKEVDQNCQIRDFNLLTIGERVRTHGDLIQQVPPQDLDTILTHLVR